jgi:hypothetical protein
MNPGTTLFIIIGIIGLLLYVSKALKPSMYENFQTLGPEDTSSKAKDLEKSLKKMHRVIESAQKKVSRTGKDKSLLKAACELGFICNKAPIIKNNNRYVNPMTSGDKLFLEEIGTYKCVEFKQGEFLDCTGRPVYLKWY